MDPRGPGVWGGGGGANRVRILRSSNGESHFRSFKSVLCGNGGWIVSPTKLLPDCRNGQNKKENHAEGVFGYEMIQWILGGRRSFYLCCRGSIEGHKDPRVPPAFHFALHHYLHRTTHSRHDLPDNLRLLNTGLGTFGEMMVTICTTICTAPLPLSQKLERFGHDACF